jgi:hypothetical protein
MEIQFQLTSETSEDGALIIRPLGARPDDSFGTWTVGAESITVLWSLGVFDERNRNVGVQMVSTAFPTLAPGDSADVDLRYNSLDPDRARTSRTLTVTVSRFSC